MRCEELREVIADHLASSLPAEIDERVQQHIAGCVPCNAELSELRELWSALGESAVPPMEVSRVRTVVLQAANATTTQPLKWRWDMRQILKAFAAIIVLAAIATGASLLLSRRTPSFVIDAEKTHVRGSASAPVSLVEYGDYECPPCASFDTLVRQYMEMHPGTLKFEFRHFPLTQLHTNALTAAKAVEAANLQGKFWVMHDAMMDSQTKWARTANAESFFIELAKQAGLDAKLFSESLRSREIESHILSEAAKAQQEGIAATPTLLLNGRKLDAAPRTVEGLDALLIEEIKRSQFR